MEQMFKPIFEKFNEEFSRAFEDFYPCDLHSGRTLAEANLTSCFVKSLRVSEEYSNAISWDEFPVPKRTRVENDSGGNIDSVIFCRKQKQIFILEAKRLKKLSKENPDTTFADNGSLPSDLARAAKAAQSDIFATRFWRDDSSQRFVPLGEQYNDYRVFGLALCGIWTRDKKYDEEDVKNAFMKGMIDGFAALKYDGVPLEKKNCLVAELKNSFPPEIAEKWQYFTLLYSWEIKKTKITLGLQNPDERITEREPNPPHGLSDILRGLSRSGTSLNSPIRETSNSAYLKTESIPASLSNEYYPSREWGIWIPLENNDNRLVIALGRRNSSRYRIHGIHEPFQAGAIYGASWNQEGYYCEICPLPDVNADPAEWEQVKQRLYDFLDGRPFDGITVDEV